MYDKYIENFILILYSNGAINSLFIAFIVITISGANYKSNKYFSLLLAVISLSCFYVLFLSDKIIMTIPYVFGGMHKSAFIYGPSLYLYFMSITSKRFRFDYKKLFHFSPFIIYTALMMPVYLSSDIEKIEIYNRHVLFFRFVFLAIFIHFISYMLYTYSFIKSNGVIIIKKFKNVESTAVNWFRYLSLLSSGVGCFCFFLFALHIFFNFSTLVLNTASDFTVVIIFHMLAYKGISSVEILQYIPDSGDQKKYTKSNMNKLQAENYMEAVIQYIEREKNYLNSELSLKHLSSSLSISEHHLSQIFSQFLQISFNDYINKLRIDEAKKLIRTLPDDYPIVRIAFDVGFNSKSSFNYNFKKFSNITPSDFKSGKID